MNKIIHRASRRRFLARATATSGAMLLPRIAKASSDLDPRSCAIGQVRMLSTLDGSAALWAYSGTVYAVRPAERPIPLFAVSGCQSQWAKPLQNGDYRMAGLLLSYFRDVGSGAFLHEWHNPFTGKRNPVAANRFAGGSAIYPANGSGMHLETRIAASESAPQGFRPMKTPSAAGPVEWTLTSDRILLRTDHAFDVVAQPQTEAQTLFADRTAFFDRDLRRLPALYAATTVIPWMRWMEMADVPGHLVWHTSGEKFFSIDELPADYRARAGPEIDAFTQRPEALDGPSA